MAKSAADLEVESERLEQELDTLKAKLADLEAQGLEGSDGELGKRELEDETMWVCLCEVVDWMETRVCVLMQVMTD